MVKKPTYFNIHPKDLPKKFFDGDMIGFYLGKYYRRNLSTNWESFVPWERFNVSIPVLSQKDVDLYKDGAVWIYFTGQWRYLGEFVVPTAQITSIILTDTGSTDTGSNTNSGSGEVIVYKEFNVSVFSSSLSGSIYVSVDGDTNWRQPLYISLWENSYGYDNFNGYAIGTISHISSPYSWMNSSGSIFNPYPLSPILENFNIYATGSYITGSVSIGSWSA